MEAKRPAIIIPTYNELANIQRLVPEIKALGVDVDIVFVDDNSPDGSGKMLDDMAKADERLFVLHRKGKLGVGGAHIHGIQWAYTNGYKVIITMDCDFTHPPKYIPEILKKAKESEVDVIVGSRFLAEKSLETWGLFRKILTNLGHILTNFCLGVPYDATSGFRLYKADRVPHYAFDLVNSRGYSFFFESLFILHFNGFKIDELPIELPIRVHGKSKMDISEMFTSLKLLFTTLLTKTINHERYLISRPLDSTQINPNFVDTQGWEEYWQDQKHSGRFLYDIIAAFYRKFIIKRNLAHFIKGSFAPDTELLHAGCGGGQVDTDISNYAKITGLDISVNALNFYKRTNPKNNVMHGSIFQIPLSNESTVGIYNLGVMEHFTEPEIDKILVEFKRVLKSDGKLVIFWPPEFGASVIFLKGVKWVLENLMGKKGVKIHPDEITRIQSKRHIEEIFKRNGFKIVKYSFSPRDLFTYSVVVAKKDSLVNSENTKNKDRVAMEFSV